MNLEALDKIDKYILKILHKEFRIRDLLKWNYKELFKFYKQNLLGSFYFDKNPTISNSIFLAGTGRSGTTWLAELLSNYYKYRIIFEPFVGLTNPITKERINDIYLPENEENRVLYKLIKLLLEGRIKYPFLDQANFIMNPKGRIIKTVSASLLVHWIRAHFPDLKIVFIIRHPCAVVSSRLKLGFNTDLSVYLKQKQLVKYHLKPYLDIIEGVKTPEEREACVWAINNLIPLNTMKPKDWVLVSYESLNLELKNGMRFINSYIAPDKSYRPSKVINLISKMGDKTKPSRKGKKMLDVWRNRLTNNQIENIMHVIDGFGFNTLYTRDLIPHKYGPYDFELHKNCF